LACLGAISHGAEPVVRTLDVRGLQIGAKTKLVFDGSDLGAKPQLLLPWPTAQAHLLPESTPTRASFEVQVPEDAIAGIEQLRFVTVDGLTAPLIVGVDRMPQLPFAPQVAALPVALHGAVTGSTVLETQFTLAAPAELTIEVESQRLGGKLRPVLHLLDEQRRQLAWSWPQRSLAGDTRLTHQFTAAGTYRVQLHDLEYAGAAPGHFRLKIGDWHRAELVFPPAITKGQSASVQLVGRLPADRVELPATDAAEPRAVPWPAGTNASGTRPVLLVSDQTELIEQPSAAGTQELAALPIAVSGRLTVPGEEDRYRVPVTPGTKLKVEVFSERLGTNLDLVLALQDEKGAVLARGDDSPGSADPLLEFTIPAGTTSVVAVVSESLGRGDDKAIYRLTAHVVVDAPGGHDFSLSTPLDRVPVAFGGRTVLPIVADRRGYDGPIRLRFEGSSANLVVQGAEIPAGADGCLVTFHGSLPSQLGTFAALGTNEDGTLRRSVLLDQHPLNNLQPWLRRDLAAMVIPFTPMTIEWGNLPLDATWTLGGKLSLPVAVTRPEGDPTPVRLALIVAQNIPRVNNNPDLNRSIRLEKPVELAPDQVVAELVTLIPTDLASTSYDVAVMAELLTSDKRSTMAVATTIPRRLAVLNPIGLNLVQANVEVKLDAKTGAIAKIVGKVERRGGFAGEVTITAAGQPAGVRAERLVVPAGMDAFEFPVTIPANFKPGELAGIRLFASGVPDATKANQTVRTKDVPVTIKIAAPDAAS